MIPYNDKMKASGLLLLLLPNLAWNLPLILNGRPRGGMLGSPGLLGSRSQAEPPPEQWFTQKLDHFNQADQQYWLQRYFVNNQFYQPGGPVFLMIGGEGPANPNWMVQGQWVQNYAPKHHALCVMLEHRFYGKSHPTKDLSVNSLHFLSSEQALADLATFAVNFTQTQNLGNAKWIAFGGSYPGSLAAWIRAKYPHLIWASVATSAPMFAQLNFPEYLGVVRDSLATTGPECNKNIKEATAQIEGLLKTKDGRQQLKKDFRLCDDIDESNPDDVANLYSVLAGNFENVVQYNKDNRAFEGAIGTNITIDILCDSMKTNGSSALQNYAKVNSIILNTYQTKCVDFVYKKMIKELRSETWESSAGEGGRQWMYQTCTEFGFYQSSDLEDQPFGQHFPLNFSVQQCADIYGSKFTPDFIRSGIKWTNANYGGYNISVSRVVFVNGRIDPWHALSITKDLNKESPAIFLNGTAHCANMYPDAQNDPPQLVEARKKIDQLITQWLAS